MIWVFSISFYRIRKESVSSMRCVPMVETHTWADSEIREFLRANWAVAVDETSRARAGASPLSFIFWSQSKEVDWGFINTLLLVLQSLDRYREPHIFYKRWLLTVGLNFSTLPDSFEPIWKLHLSAACAQGRSFRITASENWKDDLSARQMVDNGFRMLASIGACFTRRIPGSVSLRAVFLFLDSGDLVMSDSGEELSTAPTVPLKWFEQPFLECSGIDFVTGIGLTVPPLISKIFHQDTR